MFAPAFETFVAPARQRPALWRLALGLCLVAVVFLPGTFGVLFAVWWLTGTGTDFVIWSARAAAPTTPSATYLVLFGSFPLLALGTIAAARFLHRRPAATLLGRAPVVLRHFAIGAAVTLGLAALALVPALLLGFDGLPNLDPALWLMLLPLTVLGVVVQTGAEELAFRGYLQQQLAARFRSPLAWLVLPSALFAAIHWNPAALGDNVWLPLGVAFLFGLMAADLTARTGSIGAAWGIHFANNFNGIALISTQGTITGLSLYLTPYSASDPALTEWSVVPSLVMLTAAWYLTRRLTAR